MACIGTCADGLHWDCPNAGHSYQFKTFTVLGLLTKSKRLRRSMTRLTGKADGIRFKTQSLTTSSNDETGSAATTEELGSSVSVQAGSIFRSTPEACPKACKRKKSKTLIPKNTQEKRQTEHESKMRLEKRRTAKQVTQPKNLTRSRSKSTGKGKRIRKKKRTDSEDSEEEWFCLVCCDSYANSASKEKWVQCTACNSWAHQKCTDGSAYYICHNCNSDDSDWSLTLLWHKIANCSVGSVFF